MIFLVPFAFWHLSILFLSILSEILFFLIAFSEKFIDDLRTESCLDFNMH